MTPVRKRAPGIPPAPSRFTRQNPGRSAGAPVRTPGSPARAVGGLPLRARLRHLPSGLGSACGLVLDGPLQTECLGLPFAAVGASRQVFIQSSLRDAWRQGLLVESGGERSADAGAEHEPIFSDPHRPRGGEKRHG